MRAVVALWIVCAAAIAWVWLRPLGDGPLPPGSPSQPERARARKARVDRSHAAVVAPEDEPPADEPAATVSQGLRETLDRHDLENAIAKVRDKVLQCRELEQFSGFLPVRLVIATNGGVKSATVLPPLAETKTAKCALHALHGLSFPRFKGTYLPTIEWTYPFLFKDG